MYARLRPGPWSGSAGEHQARAAWEDWAVLSRWAHFSELHAPAMCSGRSRPGVRHLADLHSRINNSSLSHIDDDDGDDASQHRDYYFQSPATTLTRPVRHQPFARHRSQNAPASWPCCLHEPEPPTSDSSPGS